MESTRKSQEDTIKDMIEKMHEGSSKEALDMKKIKRKFLDSIKNYNTKYAFATLLVMVSSFENQFKKNIFDMTQFEIRNTMESLGLTTSKSVESQRSKIKKYCEWAKANHLTENIDVISWIMTAHFGDLVSPLSIRTQYISYEDYKTYIRNIIINPMDKFLLICLWNGIDGYQHSEIRNAKFSMCNFETNTITVEGYEDVVKNELDENGNNIIVRESYTRDIVLQDFEMEIIKHTHEADIYLVKNGKPSERAKVTEISLPKSDFLFQNVGHRDIDPLKPVDIQPVSTRFRMIKEWINNPQITPKLVIRSRLIHELNLLGKAYEKLTLKDYEEIVNRFNVPTTEWRTLKNAYKLLLDNKVKVAINHG